MKQYYKKLILLILILVITFTLAILGTKSDEISNLIDLTYQIISIIMFIFLIILYCLKILPKEVKKLKLKRKISKEDYEDLENFLDIDEPNDDEEEFLTFTKTSSAVINITILSKEDLSFMEPLEFTKEEKECIKKYRNQNNDDSKYLCYYYDKCTEIIKIINKYYDQQGKIKNK